MGQKREGVLDERALLVKARRGDREALGGLLAAHERACYALALRLTGSPGDAEDVCQDAFLRAANDVTDYAGLGSFRSWLFALVVHSHRNRQSSDDARRQRERSYSVIASGSIASAAPSGLERQELRRHLDISLGQLDEDYRLPIVLHHEQGLTCAEAARVLGMPEGTVKTNIKRGLEELKGMMAAAGYACTVPAMTGALAEGPAVVVPAALTAFIQSLAVAAESGAAAVGKAAASISARISSRLAAKKAAGLALGWKLGTVVTAAAIGGAAVVAVNSGMFRERPATPVAVAPEGTSPLPLPASDYTPGPIIFEDNFDQGLGNWELLVGSDPDHLVPAGDRAGEFATSVRHRAIAGISDFGVQPRQYRTIAQLSSGKSAETRVVCLMARAPMIEEAFSVTYFVVGADARDFRVPFPMVLEADSSLKSGKEARFPTTFWARWDCVPAGTMADGTPLLDLRLCSLASSPQARTWQGGLYDGKTIIETRVIACRDRRIGLMFRDGAMSIGRVEVRRLEKRTAEGGAQ